MKGKLFKKLLAVATSVLMLSVSVSVQPFADIFKDTAITASAESGEQAVYDLITEVPTVDGGQATNWNTEYDYYSLVDGNTSTVYSISNANPCVEFHYSRAFVPKKYILWTGDSWSFAYNPATWTIKAKLNKTDAWTTLATVDNSSGDQLPETDGTSKEFSIEDNTNAYKYFRFEATRKSNGPFQLGELQFKEATPKVELTWNMSDQSSMQYTISGNSADFVSNGNTMRYTWTGTPGWNLWGSAGNYLFHKAIENQLQVTFPYLTGKVTKVEINNINFSPAGMSLSVSNGTENLKNGNSDYLASTDDTSGSSVTFTGELDVNTSNYLRFTFVKTASGNVSNQRFDFMNNGSIKVTLVKEQKADLGHTFTSITANGNVLTATCTSNDADHNTLYGGAGHHYTLTLNAEDGMAEPSRPVYATITPAVSDFNEDTQLGATCTVEYAPQGTTNWTTSAPYVAGNYTARATVRINSTDYVLTTNFSVIEGHYITNNNPQQLSINKTGAMAGENITVTFTPKMGESVEALTVTGDNTSLSLGNGITDNRDNTYTFTMPNENVTIGATFNFPANSNFTQDGNTYTIKNADGWNYFCQLMQYDVSLDGFNGKTVELADNITVSTMAGTTHPFKGTFDGKGKTLTFNRTADTIYTAPFQNTNGATICNLHVTGLIEGGSYNYLGGLVGSSEGNLTIENCHVSTQISTTFDSNTSSSNVGIGGIVGCIHYTTYGQKCQITGCVYDGLIYNPNTWNQTFGCGGFVGNLSQYAYVELTDCLFIEGQYDNNGGRHELLWGNDNNKNSTFFHRSNNQGEGTLKNCFFVATHFLKQGSPAVESTTAPTNFAHFGNPTTDYGFLKVYGHTMVLGGKYYTPTYGDLVEEYDYSGVKSYNIVYDDKPLGIPDITTQLWVPLLRYKRTFTNGKPVTVMMPFNFTKSTFKKSGSSDGLTGHFYEFQGLQLSTETSKWEPKLTKEVTTMKANTPYIYVPDNEPEYWYIDNDGLGVNIFTEGYDGGNKAVTDEYGLWTLTGAYEPKSFTTDNSNIMVLNDDGKLGEVTGATTVAPTSGYFVRDNSAYSVNVSHAIGGTVTADPLYAKENDTVTLTVTPNAGYAVKRVWVDDGEITHEITPVDGVYSFTMPASHVMVHAEFEAIGYTISKTADHGTIFAKVGDAIVTTANYGESVTLDVSPDTGYTVKSVKVGNTEIEPVNGVYSFTMPDNDVTVTAEFEAIDYNISITAPANGSITAKIGDTSASTAHYGDTVALAVTPDTGYSVKSVKYNGTEATKNADGTYSFEMPAENVTVTAEFKRVYSDGIGEHLAGHSLSLNGNIGVNFYMELDADVIVDPDAYMLFTLPNNTTQTVKVTDATVDTTTVSGKTYYVFQCSVAAKEMTDTIKAQMFSGEKQGEEYSYTVKQYADYLFANAYEADGTTVKNQAYVDAIELIKSMVNYGAYSQLYFNHNTDSLANEDITDTDVSGVTAETVNKTYDGSTNTLPDGVTLAGANLELESETVMNLYFTNTTGKALTFTTSGNVALVQEQSGEYTKVTITGIAAQYLDSDVTVNVALEGDDNAYSVKYSPMNYCYNVLARETTATRTEALKDVMRAFYLYNKEAKAYFASHNN